MRTTNRATRGRGGFTLVELMVAAAVCVIIMTVLATAFQSGIDTMRNMRSVGGMQDNLRAATEVIRRDLKSQHFTPHPQRPALSGPRLADQRMDQAAWPGTSGGFFRIMGSSSTSEGTDGDGLTFTRSGGTDHLLHFTAVLTGNEIQNPYRAMTKPVPPATQGQQLSSPVAEVAYLLDQTATGATAPAPGYPSGIPLYKLVRRQRLVARRDADKSFLQTGVTADDVAVMGLSQTPSAPPAFPGPAGVCSLTDIRAFKNRLGGAAHPTTAYPNRSPADGNLSAISDVPANAKRLGDDILLTNVISFEVKANWDVQRPTSGTTVYPRPFTGASPNSDYPFDTVPGGAFDTGDGTPATAVPASPNRIRVKALQIRIRVYDPKVKLARQVTIIQDV